jgi:hypothetical protein
MTTAVQHRRGTTAEHSTFTGLEGEVTIDTTKDTAVIHDGSLAGGYPLAKETLANVNPSTLSAITGAATASDDLFLMYDTSALSMKKISRAELNNAITIEALDTVDINGGTIDGTAIGGTTPAAGAFTTLSASGSVTLSGGTANGVAYLNGSKVLTSGSALTFDGANFAVGSASAIGGGVVSAQGDLASVNGYVFKNSAANYGNTNNFVRLINSSSATVGGLTHPAAASLGVWGNDDIRFLTTGAASEKMRLTSTGLGIGTSSPTNKLSVTGNANITGNTTLGDASTDTVTVNGYMGVGGAGATNHALQISSSALGGATQRGIFSDITGTSAATTIIEGVSGRVRTAAEVFTVVDAAALKAENAIKGAGSTITNQHGLRIFDQNQGTNNYGITSLVSSGTNKWNIYASGTAANYFGGNVGIGTSSPASKLHLSGAATVDARITLTQTTAGLTSTLQQGSSGLSLSAAGSQSLLLETNGVTRATIDSSGNLGLGVTPSAWGSAYRALDLYGAGLASSTTGGQTIFAQNAYNNGSNYIYKYTAAATLYHQLIGEHRFYTAPSGTAGNAISFTQAMTLDASGRLGLGVTSPTNKLVVYDSANTAMDVQDASRTLRLGVTSAGFGYVAQVTNHPLVFSTNNTERARIDSSGNLLVGTTSLLGKITVRGSSGITVGSSLDSGATGDAYYGNISATGQYLARWEYGGSFVGSITSNGSSVAYNTTSDYRLKNTIAPMTGALAKVALLKPVTYKWNADGSDGEGFIAHELAEVVPQAVTGEKDAVDADGNPVYQGIDTSFLVATLTAAIQEQQAIIASLESRLAAAGL